MLRSFVDPFVIGRPVVQLAKFMREQCEHRGVRLNSVCVWIGGAGKEEEGTSDAGAGAVPIPGPIAFASCLEAYD